MTRSRSEPTSHDAPGDLRAPGAILLVSCYELGHSPHGLALPRAFLERAGYHPATLDLAVQPLDPGAIEKAEVVAISVPMHTALRLGTRVAARVRAERPTARVIFHGLYAQLNSRYLLEHGADYCIGGEIEAPLVGLIDALASGQADGVPGVTDARHDATPHLERLSFPVPSRDATRHEGYAGLECQGEVKTAGYTEASRGCRHGCTHCPIPPVYGGRFFVIPREVVLEDVRRQVDAGIEHVTFGDPDFLNGPRHALEIARELHREFPDLTFDFTAKVEHLIRGRNDLAELADCGALFVISAVESLSPRVLEILQKNHTREDIQTAIELTREAGIVLRPTWLPFTPWTSREDYREILEFIADESLVSAVDPIQLAIRLLVPPGSLLAEHPELLPHRGPLKQADFAYEWSHPDPGMDELQRELLSLVEAADREGLDAHETFARICTHSGWPSIAARAGAPTAAAPRLTESWFC